MKKKCVNLCAAEIFRLGFFFSVKSRSSVFLCDETLASFWPLLAGVALSNQYSQQEENSWSFIQYGLSNWELRNQAKIKTILSVRSDFRKSHISWKLLSLKILNKTLWCVHNLLFSPCFWLFLKNSRVKQQTERNFNV